MRAFLMSIILTIVLGIGWMLLTKKKHWQSGLGTILACYVSLIIVYSLEHTSLYWLVLVTPLSLFLGLIMASPKLRMMMFHARKQVEIQPEVAVKATKSKPVVKPPSRYTEDEIFAALERKGMSVTTTAKASLDDMTIGEVIKYAEENGLDIRARNSLK